MIKIYLVISIYKEDYEYENKNVVGIATTQEEKDKLIEEKASWKIDNHKDYGDTCVEAYITSSDKHSEGRVEVHRVPFNTEINI